MKITKLSSFVAIPMVLTAWLICDPDQPAKDIKGARRLISVALIWVASKLP